jgi:hypothetical protein
VDRRSQIRTISPNPRRRLCAAGVTGPKFGGGPQALLAADATRRPRNAFKVALPSGRRRLLYGAASDARRCELHAPRNRTEPPRLTEGSHPGAGSRVAGGFLHRPRPSLRLTAHPLSCARRGWLRPSQGSRSLVPTISRLGSPVPIRLALSRHSRSTSAAISALLAPAGSRATAIDHRHSPDRTVCKFRPARLVCGPRALWVRWPCLRERSAGCGWGRAPSRPASGSTPPAPRPPSKSCSVRTSAAS